MRHLISAALITLCAWPAHGRPAVDAYEGLGAVTQSEDRRCTDDGLSCIYRESYVADVCRTIERAATREGLHKEFFARLLWKESLFEPSAISPAGAEGIAQFMPSTAEIVGLDDSFNPAKAIHASAAYLRRLELGFGSLGLAAVAYNGGENRAARFLAEGGQLPYETQDYVEAITGFNAWRWRDDPPQELDLRLDGDTPFLEACTVMAGNRTLREFATAARAQVMPWGVILGSHPTRQGAQGQVGRLNRQLGPILGGRQVSTVQRRLRQGGPRVHTLQVGWNSRAEAMTFCARVRQATGANCMVLRN
ncbi:MAG: lytic transglycosylase domain-containing protein [Paracoccus sp. (in: a-proteobacteria)]|nr:lytic transglycosylase domain-containing protein [Paracoccus sp. (in: a-proteobacteria)]